MDRPLKTIYENRFIIFIVKILIIALCCYLILNKLENEKFLLDLKDQFKKEYLFVIFFFSAVLTHVQIYTTFRVINIQLNKKLKFIFFSKLVFNSQLISLMLPHSGLIYRAYRLKKYDLSYTAFVGITYFIAWFYLYLFVIFYSFELLIFGENFDFYRYLIFIVGLTFSITLYFFPNILNKINIVSFKNNLVSKIHAKISYVFLLPLKFKKINFFSFLYVYGILAHVLGFIIVYLTVKSLNIDISLNLIIIFFVINAFLDQVPITPKNLGISELFFGIMATNIGLDFEIGLAVKLLLRLYYFFNLIFFSIVYNLLSAQINK